MVEAIAQSSEDLDEQKKQKEAKERLLRCNVGHKMKFYQNGYKRRVDAAGNV